MQPRQRLAWRRGANRECLDGRISGGGVDVFDSIIKAREEHQAWLGRGVRGEFGEMGDLGGSLFLPFVVSVSRCVSGSCSRCCRFTHPWTTTRHRFGPFSDCHIPPALSLARNQPIRHTRLRDRDLHQIFRSRVDGIERSGRWVFRPMWNEAPLPIICQHY